MVTVSGVGRSYSAATKTLKVCTKDVIRFSWSGLPHNLVGVPAGSYATCSSAGGKVLAGGNTGAGSGSYSVVASKPTTSYYLCSVYGHCAAGQKLKVVVANCAHSG